VAGAADLFSPEGEAPPLPADPALLAPHELVVRQALPVVAEQTWRLTHADLDAPAHARALAVRARARADLRQHAAACTDLNEAVALTPHDADLYRQRAWLAGALGRMDDAQADLAHAFRLEPASSATARVQGLLRFEQGRFADAVAALEFRLEEHPSDPPAAMFRALARVRSGDAERGRRELGEIADASQYLEPWPKAIVAFMAGRLTRDELLAIGRGDTTEPSPVRACQAWFYLGQRAWLDGDAAKAARDFRRAVHTGGTSAVEFRLALAAARER
jgi:tetratricopeptide (TPR) repeat protein